MLPAHLIEQVPEYTATIPTNHRVFAHGDLVDMHIFIDQHQLSSIIDWGDASVTDRHYEIAKLYSLLGQTQAPT